MRNRAIFAALIAGACLGYLFACLSRSNQGTSSLNTSIHAEVQKSDAPDTHAQTVQALANTRRAIDQLRPAQEALAAALAVRLRFLSDRIADQKKDWNAGKYEAATKDIDAIQKDAERLAKGKTKAILKTGQTLLIGYHSDLDDSDQPYSLFIPKEYDGGSAYPLVILLHGQGMFNPLQCNASPIGQMVVAAPQGRGGMDYMYVGEGDVLRVIDEVQKLLKIDPNRVYLAGSSMGGSGSWHLASMFPDRFAGIMPLCGNTDINVWAELWHWYTPENSPIARIRNFMREDTCSVTYAENLNSVGIVALQGQADSIVNQRHAQHMLEALKAHGHPNYQVHLLPFVTHGINADYDMGLHDFVRDPRPLHVHYKTAWLKYPGAYWLGITGIEQRLKHAVIDGVADPAAHAVKITTTNVSEISIDRSRLPIEGPLAKVSVDGINVELPTDTKDLLHIFKDGDAWRATSRADAAAQFPPTKNEHIEGPVEHAFMSRFLLVVGDESLYDAKKNTGMYKAINQAATDLADQWKTRFAVSCRRKTVHEVSDADIADSNLILFGTPDWNALTARIIDKLPVTFDQDGIRLEKKLYKGENLGLMLCYPNPLNPMRYVVLMYGTTPRSYIDMHQRFGNWFDWVPYDYRKHFDFAVFDDLTNGRSPESFLVWGFFDEHWRMSPQLTFDAVPGWREKLRARVYPTISISDQADANKALPGVLYLDEALAKQASVNKEYLERNRGLDGGPLQLIGKEYKRGLYCRFPCSLTFNCAGYKSLKVTAGIAWDGATEPSDDRKRSEKVTIKVEAGGKTCFEAKERTYKMPPCEIEIDLNGASTVTLSANGGLPWLDDSFIWADARLDRAEAAKAPLPPKSEDD